MAERSEMSKPGGFRLNRAETCLALQRLASGYYDRPDVLQAIARRILELEDKNRT
jgi:hypothetical protein